MANIDDIRWASNGGLKSDSFDRLKDEGYTTLDGTLNSAPEYPLLQVENNWKSKVYEWCSYIDGLLSGGGSNLFTDVMQSYDLNLGVHDETTTNNLSLYNKSNHQHCTEISEENGDLRFFEGDGYSAFIGDYTVNVPNGDIELADSLMFSGVTTNPNIAYSQGDTFQISLPDNTSINATATRDGSSAINSTSFPEGDLKTSGNSGFSVGSFNFDDMGGDVSFQIDTRYRTIDDDTFKIELSVDSYDVYYLGGINLSSRIGDYIVFSDNGSPTIFGDGGFCAELVSFEATEYGGGGETFLTFTFKRRVLATTGTTLNRDTSQMMDIVDFYEQVTGERFSNTQSRIPDPWGDSRMFAVHDAGNYWRRFEAGTIAEYLTLSGVSSDASLNTAVDGDVQISQSGLVGNPSERYEKTQFKADHQAKFVHHWMKKGFSFKVVDGAGIPWFIEPKEYKDVANIWQSRSSKNSLKFFKKDSTRVFNENICFGQPRLGGGGTMNFYKEVNGELVSVPDFTGFVKLDVSNFDENNPEGVRLGLLNTSPSLVFAPKNSRMKPVVDSVDTKKVWFRKAMAEVRHKRSSDNVDELVGCTMGLPSNTEFSAKFNSGLGVGELQPEFKDSSSSNNQKRPALGYIRLYSNGEVTPIASHVTHEISTGNNTEILYTDSFDFKFNTNGMKSSQMIHMDTILSSYQGRNTDYQARCLKSGLFDRKRKTDGHTIEWYNSTSGRTLTLRLQIYGIPLRDFNVLPLPRLETGDQFMTWAGTPSDFVEPSHFEGVVYTVNNVSVERTYANERATIEQAIELSEGVSTRDGLAQPNFVDTFYSERVQRDVALNWVETGFTLDSWDSDPHFEITEE